MSANSPALGLAKAAVLRAVAAVKVPITFNPLTMKRVAIYYSCPLF